MMPADAAAAFDVPLEMVLSPAESGRMLARILIHEACPAGLVDWIDWNWIELDTHGQMWPMSHERRT